MIRRSLVKTIRKHFCSALGAILVIYALSKGADNSFKTVMTCAMLSMFVYAILFAIDRAVGLLCPVVIDLTKIQNAKLDRSDPNCLTVKTKTGSMIYLEILSSEDAEEVSLMSIDDCIRFRPSDKEYCYLKTGNNRYVRVCPEIAYYLVRKLRADKGDIKIKGLSYQV